MVLSTSQAKSTHGDRYGGLLPLTVINRGAKDAGEGFPGDSVKLLP